MVFNDVEFLVGDFKLNFQGEPENMGTKKMKSNIDIK
jgi:hypothetical protein